MIHPQSLQPDELEALRLRVQARAHESQQAAARLAELQRAVARARHEARERCTASRAG